MRPASVTPRGDGVADEGGRRSDFSRPLGVVGARQEVLLVHQLGDRAVARQARLAGCDHRSRLQQRNRLQPGALVARGPRPELRELAGDVARGDVVTARARHASLELVAGEEFDVRPQAGRVYRGFARRAGERGEEQGRQQGEGAGCH
jgi:hypothetical protein